MSENKEQKLEQTVEAPVVAKETEIKKKVSLAEFKMKSFVTNVKVDQMQFLKTAGG